MFKSGVVSMTAGLLIVGFALAQGAQRALDLVVAGQVSPTRALVMNGETYVPLSSLTNLGVRATRSGNTLTLAGGTSGSSVTSAFATGDEGWTVVGDAQGGGVRPSFMPRGGQAGGYISARDDVAGGTWYWRAPAPYRGNQSALYGGRLTFSLQQSSLNSQFEDPDVILQGGGTTLVLALPRHPGLSWTAYRVQLDEQGGWRVGSLTGPAASAAQLRSALGRVEDLRIRGEYVEGADTGGLDTVALSANACPLP